MSPALFKHPFGMGSDKNVSKISGPLCRTKPTTTTKKKNREKSTATAEKENHQATVPQVRLLLHKSTPDENIYDHRFTVRSTECAAIAHENRNGFWRDCTFFSPRALSRYERWQQQKTAARRFMLCIYFSFLAIASPCHAIL